jgi:hypothetical protein
MSRNRIVLKSVTIPLQSIYERIESAIVNQENLMTVTTFDVKELFFPHRKTESLLSVRINGFGNPFILHIELYVRMFFTTPSFDTLSSFMFECSRQRSLLTHIQIIYSNVLHNPSPLTHISSYIFQ